MERFARAFSGGPLVEGKADDEELAADVATCSSQNDARNMWIRWHFAERFAFAVFAAIVEDFAFSTAASALVHKIL